jgi:hypothetical protein
VLPPTHLLLLLSCLPCSDAHTLSGASPPHTPMIPEPHRKRGTGHSHSRPAAAAHHACAPPAQQTGRHEVGMHSIAMGALDGAVKVAGQLHHQFLVIKWIIRHAYISKHVVTNAIVMLLLYWQHAS